MTKSELSSTELQLARAVIEAGLQSAAKQLSFFMKEVVSLNHIEFEASPLQSKADADGLLYLLCTHIIGELGGLSYLVFDEKEADLLRRKALADVAPESPTYAALKDAILLEIDNIIAAAVITQFSNLLKSKVHGSVPELQLATRNETQALLAAELAKNAYIIDFKAKFTAEDSDFSPVFIWFLDQSFVDTIKQRSLL